MIASDKVPGMVHWREVVFTCLRRNSEISAVYFGIATGQVIEIGSHIEF